MTNPLEKLHTVLDATLTQDERAELRLRFARHRAAPATRIPSPYFHVFQMSAFAFVALLLVTGPVIASAERALPNDSLYSLKIRIVEPAVLAVVSPFDAAEARVNASLVERRLREAQALIVQGGYDETDFSELSEDIETHTRATYMLIAPGEDTSLTDDDIMVGSSLENSLEAYEVILTKLSEDTPRIKEDVEPLLARVVALGDEAEDTNERLEQEEETTEEYEDRESALARSLSLLAEDLSALPDPTDPLAVEASALLTKALDAHTFSVSAHDAGEAEAAADALREAEDAAAQARIILDARERQEEEG